ncbi:hydrolase-domain-containing protein [Wallemia mellicola]|nr:hydrolase-domain-containing protein [Wallemia mellicola]
MPSSTAPAEIIVSIMAKYNAYLTERQVDAVLFDMDGTLVNSIAAVEAAWGAVADEIGQPRKSVIEATHGRRASDNLKDWKPDIKDEHLDGEVAKFEQTILDHADQYKKRRDSRSSSQSSSRRASSSSSSRRPSQAQLFGSFTPIDKSRQDSTSQQDRRPSSGTLAQKLQPLSLQDNSAVESEEAVEDEEDEDLGPDMGVKILPGVKSLIDSLPKGRYAVATSGARVYAYGAMERAGIVAPDVTITAEDPRLENGKPHPDPFLLAAKCLGYDCNKCLVVEDSPSGIKAGVASGATTLAVCTSHEKEQIENAGAQHLVRNLEAVRAEQLADGRIKITIDPARIVTDSKSDARTDVGLKDEDK